MQRSPIKTIDNSTDIVSSQLSLFDIIKKRVDKSVKGVFDSTCLEDDGSVLSFNEQVAIVTHYLMLQNSGQFCDTYEDKGRDILKLWYEFVNGEESKETTRDILSEDAFYGSFFNNVTTAPFKAQSTPSFRFIDLFAGIGGFRIAMQHRTA